MKKVYALLSLLATSTTMLAQNDFAVQIGSYPAGSVVNNDTVEFQFALTNLGTTDLPAGDTVWAGISINGQLYSLNFVPGGVSGFILPNPLAPNASIAFPIVTLQWDEEIDSTFELCGVVFGTGASSFSGPGPSIAELIVGDVNTANNFYCIDVNYSASSANIETSEVSALQLFYTNGELIVQSSETIANKIGTIKVVDLNGKTVFDTVFENSGSQTNISLNALRSGVYVVFVEVDGVVETKKIVVN